MRLSGADLLVKVLEEEGVSVVFGYPGAAVLHIFESLSRSGVRPIVTAHEQGAVHAADGYARTTGRVGVALATSGPGATNLITGIATAYMDSIPLVALTGNVHTELIGKDSFQEVYIAGMAMPITKHTIAVRRVEELGDALREAFRIARSGRPGPVLVDIPRDVTMQTAEYTPTAVLGAEPPALDPRRLEAMAGLIAASRRPVLYYGGGVLRSGAAWALKSLVERASIPACHTMMGIGVLPTDHPLNLGMVGMHGKLSASKAIEACDLLLGVGVRFSDRAATNRRIFAPNARRVQIDIDASEISKNVAVEDSLIADAGAALRKLAELVRPGDRGEWLAEIERMQREWDLPPEGEAGRIHPAAFMRELARAAGPETVIATDVGQHQLWTAQYYPFEKPNTFLSSGGLGTMGFGMGAAIGAAIAQPGRRVALVTGDGSFHMNLNELATAVSYRLPIVVCVLDNRGLGMVRQWETLYFGREVDAAPVRQTDYVALARAFGARGYAAAGPAELPAVLAAAFGGEGPCVVRVPILPEERVLPVIPPGGTVEDCIRD